jgi:hypothetical protein
MPKIQKNNPPPYLLKQLSGLTWILNQSDFKDVYQTTLVGGTISNIQQDEGQDNPFKVISMVKVKLKATGEETDYLPIFFLPKKEYWDIPEHDAQDFNEDEKYYENAWMSFRGGDEVVVVSTVKEEGGSPQPLLVLAFADGVPRIGEALFNLQWGSHQCDVQMLQINDGEIGDIYQGDWDIDYKGPDGANLLLKRECVPQYIKDLYDSKSEIYWNYYIPAPPYDPGPDAQACFYSKYYSGLTLKLYAVLIPVGPILYYIPIITGHSYDVQEVWLCVISPPIVCPDLSYYHGDSPPDVDTPHTHGTWSLWSSGGDSYYGVYNPYDYQDELIVKAALYKPELENNPTAPDFIPQTFNNNQLRSAIINILQTQDYDNSWGYKPGFKFFVRPHTKKELQAAGMWPPIGTKVKSHV